MPINYRDSLGYLRARQGALEAQRAQVNNVANLDRAQGQHVADQLLSQGAERDQEQRQAYGQQAQAQGTEAGYSGTDPTDYGNDRLNALAQAGASGGRMNMAQFIAKNEATRAQQIRGGQINAGNERAKFTYENPILHQQRLEDIDRAGRWKNKAALSGNPSNPALTTGATTQVEKDIMTSNQNLRNIHAARGALDKLTADDFGLFGGARDMMSRGVEFLRPGTMAKLDPAGEGKRQAITELRLTHARMANRLLAQDSGKAVTPHEFQRKQAELGELFGNGTGIMFNNYADMVHANKLMESMEQDLQGDRMTQLGNGITPYGGSRPGQSAQQTDGGAPPSATAQIQDGGYDENGDPVLDPAGGYTTEDPREIPFDPSAPNAAEQAVEDTPQAPKAAAPQPRGQPSPYANGQRPPGAQPQVPVKPKRTQRPAAKKVVATKAGQQGRARKADLDSLRANSQGDDDAFVEQALKAGYTDDDIHPYIR